MPSPETPPTATPSFWAHRWSALRVGVALCALCGAAPLLVAVLGKRSNAPHADRNDEAQEKEPAGDPRSGGAGHGRRSATTAHDSPAFTTLAPGVTFHTGTRVDPSGAVVTWNVVRVDPARVALHAARVPQSRLETLARAQWSSFSLNAGFFNPDLSPTGLVVVDGVRVHAFTRGGGSGVLVVQDGTARITSSPPPELGGIALAIQCGPRLVEPGGVDGMRSDDGKRAARTVACVRRGGSELDFVVAFDPKTLAGGPTLFQTARWLIAPLAPGDTDGCEAALNLDGGPSTGLVAPALAQTEWRLPAGPVPWAIVGTVMGPGPVGSSPLP